jgi:hypothetical protein
MTRSRTTKNIYAIQQGKLVEIGRSALREAIGPAEQRGCWFIYGAEKNGKTSLALMLAKELSAHERVAYISAEEGLDKSFIDSCRRAGITTADRIVWDEYLPVDDIVAKYSKPQAARIVIIDNLTMYQDEVKPSELKRRLVDALRGKLVILLGHEERRLPFPAVARMAGKIAKVIFHVRGLRASVVSRFSAGGEIILNESNSRMYWGEADNGQKGQSHENQP